MKYKAIFIDLDGTLLNRRGRISRVTVRAVKAAQKKGILVVVNSGRTPYEIEKLLRKFSLSMPYVALNGAYARVLPEKTIIYKKPMTFDLSQEILRISRKHDSNSFWYTARYSYAHHLKKYPGFKKFDILQFLYEKIMLLSRRFAKNREFKEKLLSDNREIYKCGFMCTDRRKLKALRKEIDKLGCFETALTSPVFLECNQKGITKGSGLKHLLAYYNLSQEEAIAIGDSENDIPMLQAAGLGIAMGNAPSNVKQTANSVAATNALNGVAKVIYKYFL